jgi:hypothetical protein
VSSSTTRPAERNGGFDETLRRPLRAALTELVLAGVPLQKIMSMVTAELSGLLRKPR